MHKEVGAAIVWGDEARIILAPTLIRQQADRASDIACLAEAISVQTNLPFGCAPRKNARNCQRRRRRSALKVEAQKAIQNGEFGKADEISFATVNRPTTFGRRFTNPVAYRRAASSGSSTR